MEKLKKSKPKPDEITAEDISKTLGTIYKALHRYRKSPLIQLGILEDVKMTIWATWHSPPKTGKQDYSGPKNR